MTTHVRSHRTHRPRAAMRRSQLGRLGAGLLVLGGAGFAHSIWGVAIDLPILLVGAGGLVWALASRHVSGMIAGVVLVAISFFALLDDHGVFNGLADALTLLALAAAVLLVHGLPLPRRDPWPLLPAGTLVLMAAFVAIRVAAAWAAMPWTPLAPLLVLLAGLALLGWDAWGGRAP